MRLGILSRMKVINGGDFICKATFTLVFLFSSFYAFSQKGTSQIRGSSCFVVSKLDKEYSIHIGGVDYRDGDKVFICNNDLSMELEILYMINSNPVVGSGWDWKACECKPDLIKSYVSSIDIGHFEGDSIANVEVKFIEEDSTMTNYKDTVVLNLDIMLISNVELDIYESHLIAKYGFDESKEKGYPFYNNEIPWKFLDPTQTDKVKINDHKNILKNAKLSTQPTNDLSYVANSNILSVGYIGVNDRDSLASLMCNEDTLFMVDVYRKDSLFVNIYELCESDDDTANYCIDKNGNGTAYEQDSLGNYIDVDGFLQSDCTTPIDSFIPTGSMTYEPQKFECIDQGLDGSLDYYFELQANKYWRNRDLDNTKPSVTLILDSLGKISTVKAFASLDTSTNKYYCNKLPLVFPDEFNQDVNGDGILDAYVELCPPVLSISDKNAISNNLNIIYNQAGVKVMVNFNGQSYENYDNSLNLNLATQLHLESGGLHSQILGGTPSDLLTAETTTVWIVDTLIQPHLAGRSIGDVNQLRNSVLVDYNDMNIRTISHEIGHAKYQLFHPDESTCHGGIDLGWQKDNLKNQVVSDYYNFMNSGCLFPLNTANDIYLFRVRRYQWKYIQDGK